MKVRKQVYDLTLDDLSEHPAWEFALEEEGEEGQDEATVRPYAVSGVLDPADGMFVIAARFMLSDGSEMQGYLTPPVGGNFSLGIVQPHIVTSSGQVPFWFGIAMPDDASLRGYYDLLGRQASSVFPLRYQPVIEIVGGPVTGTITGFGYLVGDFKTKGMVV
ncbi:MAG: hypothetical protein ACREBD_39730 [Blastocatellia bacterium]